MNQLDSATDNYTAQDAVLVLEDGQVYIGEPYGAVGATRGEIVFSTAMTGYQETLTDPSYDRQIVVQTFPPIGDTGVNPSDPESSRISVAGYVVRDPSGNVSNWRATGSLDDALVTGQTRVSVRAEHEHLMAAHVHLRALLTFNLTEVRIHTGCHILLGQCVLS